VSLLESSEQEAAKSIGKNSKKIKTSKHGLGKPATQASHRRVHMQGSWHPLVQTQIKKRKRRVLAYTKGEIKTRRNMREREQQRKAKAKNDKGR
jgi:hypothetical protein